jgi:hypothetical protein
MDTALTLSARGFGLDGASLGRAVAAVATVEVAGGLEAIELGTSDPNDQALHAFTPTCAMPSHPGAMLRLVLRVIWVRVRLDRVIRLF